MIYNIFYPNQTLQNNKNGFFKLDFLFQKISYTNAPITHLTEYIIFWQNDPFLWTQTNCFLESIPYIFWQMFPWIIIFFDLPSKENIYIYIYFSWPMFPWILKKHPSHGFLAGTVCKVAFSLLVSTVSHRHVNFKGET